MSGTKAAEGSLADMEQLLNKQNEQLLLQKRILEDMLSSENSGWGQENADAPIRTKSLHL